MREIIETHVVIWTTAGPQWRHVAGSSCSSVLGNQHRLADVFFCSGRGFPQGGVKA